MSLLLVALALFLGARDILHPAVIFPFIWGVTILVIGLAEPFGYLQISGVVFLLFVLGNFSFIFGALLGGGGVLNQRTISTYDLDFEKIGRFCIVLHVVMVPLSWMEVNQIAGGIDDIFAAAYRLRASSVSGEEVVGVVVGNYLFSGLFFIPVLMVGWLREKVYGLTFFLLTLPWFLLNIFIAGRSGVVMLVLALFYIGISLTGKISGRFVAIFGLIFVSILVVGNLLVGKIDAGVDDGFYPIIKQSVKGFFDYYLQGPILFSEYHKNPDLINPTWDAFAFPCQMLAKINLCDLPVLHQEFMAFSEDRELGNVYSLFFSIYPKYGWLGVVLITFGYGFWAGFHHARRNISILHLLVGAFLFSATVLSIFNDAFGQSVYFLVKIIILSVAVSLVFKKT
ncbi:MAG: oligosaccharide repeat unit polymerase [Polaromonas sp.]|nr:oligosaccharide repeat unit polymerase [Polaromonas sp.]